MDAIDFLKEREYICNDRNGICKFCPLSHNKEQYIIIDKIMCNGFCFKYPESAVKIVADERNRRQTREMF